jgi:hypothetical protein
MESAVGERPVVASLRELDESQGLTETRQWAVLHTVTESGLQLIHWKPIRSPQLTVRIEFPRNETLEILVAIESSESYGSLYGTAARFHSPTA